MRTGCLPSAAKESHAVGAAPKSVRPARLATTIMTIVLGCGGAVVSGKDGGNSDGVVATSGDAAAGAGSGTGSGPGGDNGAMWNVVAGAGSRGNWTATFGQPPLAVPAAAAERAPWSTRRPTAARQQTGRSRAMGLAKQAWTECVSGRTTTPNAPARRASACALGPPDVPASRRPFRASLLVRCARRPLKRRASAAFRSEGYEASRASLHTGARFGNSGPRRDLCGSHVDDTTHRRGQARSCSKPYFGPGPPHQVAVGTI
jgi:hypothetical protein